MSELLKVSQEGAVRRMALDRPERANALNDALCHALVAEFESAAADPATRAIVLEASGKVFCSGMAFDEPAEPGSIAERLFSIGMRLPKPIVAAVQGPVLGAGLGLLANCQCVVAAMGSSFGLTEMRLGLFPVGWYRSLARAIGERRALELALTARVFQTDEALRLGLIHAVAPEFELEDRVMALAGQMAGFSPVAMRFGLAYVHQQRTLDEETAARVARALEAQMLAGPDFAEGQRAFAEKRRPQWPSVS